MAAIDPALAIELKAYTLQKPMNDVIDNGDSEIQKLYNGTNLFITGGGGFIGKQLIEKLLRACNINKIYVLIRSKKGKTIQQRIQTILTNPVFDTLRKKKPYFEKHIFPIEGDVSDPALGICDSDWKLLTQEVNIIFHAAATTRFDEPLRYATLTNVRGTREVIQIAKECKNLIKLVHVSTAFSNATTENINKEIFEDFNKCPMSPKDMICLAENLDEIKINNITKDLINGWPNTYTFTKALAEELVRITAGDLPVCIVRPPIVIPSYYEPSPGWLDFGTLGGPSGILLAVGLGILHIACVDINIHLSMAPVDVVNNTIITSVWDSTEQTRNCIKSIPIYTIARKDFLQWNFLANELRNSCSNLYSPKLICNAWVFETKYRPLYFVLALFIHYIPAFLLDIICTVLNKKPKEISSFVDVYSKIDILTKVYNYFLTNEWDFRDDNVQAMIKRMSTTDKIIFNCDMRTIDKKEYVKIWWIGLRRFIIKDGLKGSADGIKKNNIFSIIYATFSIAYIYILWCIFYATFGVVRNIFV